MQDVDLSRYLRSLWKWSWLIIACACVAAVVSYTQTRSSAQVYRSSATVLVGDDLTKPSVSLDQITASQRLAATYANMAKMEPVLSATVATLRLPADWRELRNRVLVVRSEGSQLLEIRVVDTDPVRAKATVDEILRQLIIWSPTADYQRQVQEQRGFLESQLATLESRISEAETQLAEKRTRLGTEVSARGVLDLQDEIRALELKLDGWRSSYTSLLASYRVGTGNNTLTVVEPAVVPGQPVGGGQWETVALAAALAALIAAFGVLLFDRRFQTIDLPADVSAELSLPTLGLIAKPDRSGATVGLQHRVFSPGSSAAEGYRILRTNLNQALGDDKGSVILVTSPVAYDGLASAAVSLSVSFAMSGRRTILVDANLREPQLHTLLGVRGQFGLTSLFLEDLGLPTENQTPAQAANNTLNDDLDQALLASVVPGLRLLAAGPRTSASPTDLFATPEMEVLLAALVSHADIVVVCAPPVLPLADVAVLCPWSTGVLLVMPAGRTLTRHARDAVAAIVRASGRVLGVALDRVALRDCPYVSALERSKASNQSIRAAAATFGGGARQAYGWFARQIGRVTESVSAASRRRSEAAPSETLVRPRDAEVNSMDFRRD